jgi:hypothetical protein
MHCKPSLHPVIALMVDIKEDCFGAAEDGHAHFSVCEAVLSGLQPSGQTMDHHSS